MNKHVDTSPLDPDSFNSAQTNGQDGSRARMIARIRQWIDNTEWSLNESTDQHQDVDQCQRVLTDPHVTVESFQDDPTALTSKRWTAPERFTNLSYIASGAFGIVWSVDDQLLGRTVALKILRPSRSQSSEVCARFLGEAQAAERLSHPGIIRVHDTGKVGSLLYMVCEKIEGGTLAHWLGHHAGPLSAMEVAQFTGRVAEALHEAHTKAILHRDIKPGNILLQPIPGGNRDTLSDYNPVVTDFGLAKQTLSDGDQESLTQDGALMGTAQYMSPEQARGDWNSFNTTSEVFSLGIMLFQMLTGQLPFSGHNNAAIRRAISDESSVRPRSIRKDIPLDLEAILLKCLQPSIRERYQSMYELQLDLQRFVNGEPVEATRPSWLRRTMSSARKHPITASILAFTLVFNVVALLTVAMAWRASSQARRLEQQSAANLFGTYVDLTEEVLTGAKPVPEVLRASVNDNRQKLREQLVRTPDDPTVRHRLSMLEHLSSQINIHLGHTEESQYDRVRACGLLHQLLEDNLAFSLKEVRFQRFYSMINLANQYIGRPEIPEVDRQLLLSYELPTDADAMFRSALDDIAWLVKQYPDEEDYADAMAHTLLSISHTKTDATERLPMITEAVSISRQNWEKHRERPILIKTAIAGTSKLALQMLADNKPSEALAIIRSNAEFFDEAFIEKLEQSWVQHEYLLMADPYIEIAAANNEPPIMEEVFQRAAKASEGMVVHNPNSSAARLLLVNLAARCFQYYTAHQDAASAEKMQAAVRAQAPFLDTVENRTNYSAILRRYGMPD